MSKAFGRYALSRNTDGSYSVQDVNSGDRVSRLDKERGDTLVRDWFGADILAAVLKHDYFSDVVPQKIRRRYPEDFAPESVIVKAQG